ncbi:hypothetical protein RIF29_29801 [Crotalaria pallida]|uniref:Pseudouridine synthase RsuA/RluA-like domain-containing protein n=1 Tax=Crotalaria pallida TaxID=3830 RepID=A0AAN9HWJ2_CROPI
MQSLDFQSFLDLESSDLRIGGGREGERRRIGSEERTDAVMGGNAEVERRRREEKTDDGGRRRMPKQREGGVEPQPTVQSSVQPPTQTNQGGRTSTANDEPRKAKPVAAATVEQPNHTTSTPHRIVCQHGSVAALCPSHPLVPFTHSLTLSYTHIESSCRCSIMLSNNTTSGSHTTRLLLLVVRHYSRIRPPKAVAVEKVIRVSNNIARLDAPKEGPKPRQLLSLPPFPRHPLPGKNSSSVPGQPDRVTAVNWIKYYFKGMWGSVIESHFREGLVQIEDPISDDSFTQKEGLKKPWRKIKPNEVMKPGARLHVPVSMGETRISKRYDAIPSGTLYPNADEIKYLQRLVIYKDSAIIVLNKPPKLPVKGNLPVHNSMDALAAAALSYDNDEGPKLVHRLDRESSGILLLGRTKDSVSHLQWLFSSINNAKSSIKAWNDACEVTYQRYWALVIGTPKEKEGIIHAPLSKVLLNDGKTERVILANHSGIEPRQEAVTEYRVLGPKINGCSWIELRPLTYRKHQLRVHCAEALGTPIVGDYKYGWFVHSRWKQMPRVDIEPTTGIPYKMRRPEGLDVQKGSVLSKVPLLHLHCRELVLPNVAKFMHVFQNSSKELHPSLSLQPDVLRFVATMPSHMRISWNLMSSYLV